jgi:hypothetical protein
LATFFATDEGKRRLAVAAIRNMPVSPSAAGYAYWLPADFPDIVGKRLLSLGLAQAIVDAELEGQLFDPVIVRSVRLAHTGGIDIAAPLPSWLPTEVLQPVRASRTGPVLIDNVTPLPGNHQATWMVQFGLPAADPTRTYSVEELREYARTFQVWKRTRTGPLGQDRAYRLYKKLELLPKVSSVKLFWTWAELKQQTT